MVSYLFCRVLTEHVHYEGLFLNFPVVVHGGYMDISKNRGTPKSSSLIGFSLIFTIYFGGTGYPHFRKHPYIESIFCTWLVRPSFFCGSIKALEMLNLGPKQRDDQLKITEFLYLGSRSRDPTAVQNLDDTGDRWAPNSGQMYSYEVLFL